MVTVIPPAPIPHLPIQASCGSYLAASTPLILPLRSDADPSDAGPERRHCTRAVGDGGSGGDADGPLQRDVAVGAQHQPHRVLPQATASEGSVM